MIRQLNKKILLYSLFFLGCFENKVNLLLIDAAREGNPEKARAALEKGANSNYLKDDIMHVLGLAVESRSCSTVEVLLEYGSRVNETSLGYPPIYDAIRNRDLEMISILVKHGANLSIKTPNGNSLVHFACFSEDLGLLEKLADLEFPMNIPDENGFDPFQYACASGKSELALWFLDKGADPNLPSDQGLTPLEIALGAGNLEIEKALLVKGAKADKDLSSLRIFGKALNGTLTKEEVCLHPNINITNHYSQTPVFFAVYSNKVEMLEWLFECGADFHKTDSRAGRTPLHHSVLANQFNPAIIQFLINQGLDINSEDKLGMTPLELAIKQGNKAAATILVENHAKLPNLEEINELIPSMERREEWKIWLGVQLRNDN